MSKETALKSAEAFITRLDAQKRKIAPFVCFYGGEPLIRFGLVKNIVAFFEERFSGNPQYFVNTNGTYLTREKFNFLRDNRFMVRVSLDGPKEIHDRNRKDLFGEGTFDGVIKNLTELRKFDERYFRDYVSLSFVVSDPKEIPLLNSFFSSNFVVRDIPKICAQISCKLLKNPELSKPFSERDLQIVGGDYTKFVSSVETSSSIDHPFNFWWAKYLINIHRRPLTNLSDEIISPNLCIPGAHRLVVHPDGHYGFCIQGADTFNIGDVRRGIDYEEVYKLIQKTESMLSQRCPSCWCARLCPVCPAKFASGTNLSHSLLDSICLDIRRHIERSFEYFIRISRDHPEAMDKIVSSEEKRD